MACTPCTGGLCPWPPGRGWPTRRSADPDRARRRRWLWHGPGALCPRRAPQHRHRGRGAEQPRLWPDRGQYSPTSDKGMRTPTSPEGAIDGPVPPLALAITMGATFVARGYAGELRHLVWIIGEALQHRGYALVDVLQPCVTFNRPSAYDFYNPRVYKLEESRARRDRRDGGLGAGLGVGRPHPDRHLLPSRGRALVRGTAFHAQCGSAGRSPASEADCSADSCSAPRVGLRSSICRRDGWLSAQGFPWS